MAWALMWIPIAIVKEPLLLVSLLTIQALFSAASIPAWTALLIISTPRYKVSQVQGSLNAIANFASFVGTLLAGLILNKFGFLPFIFYLIAFFGMMSRILFFNFPEPRLFKNSGDLSSILRESFAFSKIKEEKELLS